MNPQIREALTETRLAVSDFIYPLFIREGKGIKNEVSSMPGVYQMSVDTAIEEIRECQKLGVNSFILFGIPSVKDSIGSDALCEHGIIAEALKAIKDAHPSAMVATDLCFCEYTDHGHCGILNTKLQTVDNDATLEILARQAIIHAKHGADLIAPSGMMDGTIETLRVALDSGGYSHLPLMAYSTKFASAYYGPFRDVAESAPSFGDRRSYQMNPANRLEAIEESLEDERQGADILMVKPALAYLDIIRDIRERTNTPIAAYNVSGEYAMLKMAGKMGLIDYNKAMMETLLSIKRAGAGIIISYHAKEAAKLINS